MTWKDYFLNIKPITVSNSSGVFFYPPGIKHIHCDPKHKVTVVIFNDNSKSICRCSKEDEYNEYAGICICIAKHLYGKSRLEKIINSKKKVIYNNCKEEK